MSRSICSVFVVLAIFQIAVVSDAEQGRTVNLKLTNQASPAADLFDAERASKRFIGDLTVGEHVEGESVHSQEFEFENGQNKVFSLELGVTVPNGKGAAILVCSDKREPLTEQNRRSLPSFHPDLITNQAPSPVKNAADCSALSKHNSYTIDPTGSKLRPATAPGTIHYFTAVNKKNNTVVICDTPLTLGSSKAVIKLRMPPNSKPKIVFTAAVH